MHWLLYALLFVLPILGWINASWRGMPIVMFGLELPKLVATRAPGWGWTGDVHGLLANYVLLTLVGLHVAAALYHYFIRRDGVLQRMLALLVAQRLDRIEVRGLARRVIAEEDADRGGEQEAADDRGRRDRRRPAGDRPKWPARTPRP